MDVLFSFSSKLLFYTGAFCSSIIVALTLNPEAQGYFFTFMSLVSSYILVELGFSSAIINFCSHEFAVIYHSKSERDVSDARSRVNGLARLVTLWFASASLVFCASLIVLGYFLFASQSTGELAWPWPWVMLCLVLIFDVALLPFFFLLEGGNQVRTVYAYRSLKAIVLYGTMWVGLFFGAELWSIGIAYAATVPLSLYVIFVTKRAFFEEFLFKKVDGPKISWWDEVFPYQWKIAISWVCGYVTTWSITPVSLLLYGPVIAGKIGFTWSIAMGVIAISNSVITIQAPKMGQYVARKSYRDLDRVVAKFGAFSVALSMCGGAVVLLGTYGLEYFGFAMANRMLPVNNSIFIFLGLSVLQVTQPMAVYLRAYKKEPFLVVSIGFSILFIGLIFVLNRYLDTFAISVSYFLTCLFFVLPLGSLIFYNCRNKWQKLGSG